MNCRAMAFLRGYPLIWKRGKGRLMFTIGGGKVLAIAGGRVPWVLQQECV